MKKLIFVVFILFSVESSAQLLPEAPWTQSEWTSLRSLGAGCLDVASAYDKAWSDWKAEADPEANRGAFSEGTQDLGQAYDSCNDALAKIAGVVGQAGGSFGSRALQVAAGKNDVVLITTRLNDASSKLPPAYNRNFINNAKTKIAGFDTSLSYGSWRPADFPSILAVHGDYDYAVQSLAFGQRYAAAHASYDLARIPDPSTAPNSNTFVRDRLRQAAAHMVQVLRGDMRATLLEMYIFPDDDYAIIQAMEAASNGLRPPAFHRTVLALRYVFNGGSPPSTIEGMNICCQVPDNLFAIHQRVQDVGAVLSDLNPGWADANMHRDANITIGAPTSTPYAELIADIMDGWRGNDAYGWAVMGFFHGVTIPPSNVSLFFCGNGTHQSEPFPDGTIACLPDDATTCLVPTLTLVGTEPGDVPEQTKYVFECK